MQESLVVLLGLIGCHNRDPAPPDSETSSVVVSRVFSGACSSVHHNVHQLGLQGYLS